MLKEYDYITSKEELVSFIEWLYLTKYTQKELIEKLKLKTNKYYMRTALIDELKKLTISKLENLL
jgi:hypothetical protein